MANPIQLLIELQSNRAKGNSNIDQHVQALRKYYEKNPLLINIDINKGLALKNIDNFIKQVSKQKIELDVGIKGGKTSSELSSVKNQTKDVIKEFEQLNRVMNNSTKSGHSFEKTVESARKLQSELAKIGTVNDARLSAFSNAIVSIGNSSLSTEQKIMHLNRAMDSIKNTSKNLKFNEQFADGIQRSSASLDRLETKLKNMGKNSKIKYDTQSLAEATSKLNALRTSLAQVTNPTQLQRLNRQFRELSNEIGKIESRSNSLGNALKQAFGKFPIWMLTSTVFYAPLRGLQDLTKQVLELDKALVEMRRVELQPLTMVTLLANLEYAGNPSYSFN